MTSTTKMADVETVVREVRALADEFAQHRSQRQRRRELDRADFYRLHAAGFQLTGVPVEIGGLRRDSVHSTRPIAEMLRALARGDSSVALVASMHPAVLFPRAGWRDRLRHSHTGQRGRRNVGGRFRPPLRAPGGAPSSPNREPEATPVGQRRSRAPTGPAAGT